MLCVYMYVHINTYILTYRLFIIYIYMCIYIWYMHTCTQKLSTIALPQISDSFYYYQLTQSEIFQTFT